MYFVNTAPRLFEQVLEILGSNPTHYDQYTTTLNLSRLQSLMIVGKKTLWQQFKFEFLYLFYRPTISLCCNLSVNCVTLTAKS